MLQLLCLDTKDIRFSCNAACTAVFQVIQKGVIHTGEYIHGRVAPAQTDQVVHIAGAVFHASQPVAHFILQPVQQVKCHRDSADLGDMIQERFSSLRDCFGIYAPEVFQQSVGCHAAEKEGGNN